jgi:hypothetical protein
MVMIKYEIAVRPELMKVLLNGRFDPIDEVQQWLSDNKVFGWCSSHWPMKQEYYIHFTNTTDAMLFMLRWS